MKKVLAILFALVIVLSFAACGKDNNSENKTKATAAQGTPDMKNTEVEIEIVTDDPSAEIDITGTVEEWVANNQELVDQIAASASTTEDGMTLTMVISAEINALYMTGVISGEYTDEDVAEAEAEAQAQQAEWDALSAEDKELALQDMILEETMPVPDSVYTIICDEEGNVIAYTVYSK